MSRLNILQLKYNFGDLHSVTERFLENIHTMLNEPSVGLYRVQEHVRRSLPQLVDKKVLLLNVIVDANNGKTLCTICKFLMLSKGNLRVKRSQTLIRS